MENYLLPQNKGEIVALSVVVVRFLGNVIIQPQPDQKKKYFVAWIVSRVTDPSIDRGCRIRPNKNEIYRSPPAWWCLQQQEHVEICIRNLAKSREVIIEIQ